MSYPAGRLDIDRIMDTIIEWASDFLRGVVTPEQIIWRQSGEPLPARPCVTFRLISGPSPTDRDPNVFQGDGTDTTYGLQQEMVVSVQIFGNTKKRQPSAHQIAIDLNSSLMESSVRQKLNVGGVSIQGLGHVENRSALEESRWEERYGFDVELGLVQNITDKHADVIKQVNVQGKVNGTDLPPQSVTLP